MSFDRRIIESLLPVPSLITRLPFGPTVSYEIAHYTRTGTLCRFFPGASSSGVSGWNTAWATPVQFLNDRLELALGLDKLAAAANSLSASKRIQVTLARLAASPGSIGTDVFQMSFSGNPDELGQWRGYAANGMGCAVVTSSSDVSAVADVAGWVIYDPAAQMAFATNIIISLAGTKNIALLQKYLVTAASFMKHPGFEPEREFRFVKFPLPVDVQFRETGDRLVPFVDFLGGSHSLPVGRIVIGPGWQISGLGTSAKTRHHVVQAIQRLLSARGMTRTKIDISAIPYDPK